MEHFTISLFAVICAAVVGFLVRALWYSKYLFLEVWLKSEGVSKVDIVTRSKPYLFSVSLYSLIAHSAIAGVFALTLEFFQIKDYKTAISLVLLFTFGFMITTRYIDMLYTYKEEHFRKKSQVSFLVASGYYILASVLMALTLVVLS